MEKVFGIDLGTTYSCIAHIDESGKSVIIENAQNERTTPSVVFFESADNVIAGNIAKNALETDPERVVSFIKREMGNPDYMPFDIDGKEFSAEQISSVILTKLVGEASDKLGEEIKKVVITCPAYFGNNEREATKNAGRIAGLEVLAIINEPTAAAISFGVENQGDQTVLVYDLGGGTFDVTIMKISAGKIDVIATGGDHELGGKNWDETIINFLADKFKEQSGVDENILMDTETFGELQLKAEIAKKELTERNESKVKVIYGGFKENIVITKEDFEQLAAGLIEQTIQLTNSTIENAKNKDGGISQIDKILLVGGSTRMPMVRVALEQNYSAPIETYKPDEAVALGAALYAQNIEYYNALLQAAIEKGHEVESVEEVQDLIDKGEIDTSEIVDSNWSLGSAVVENIPKITNVISRSYGIAAHDNGADSGKSIFNLIKKDTSLPIEKEQRFGTLFDNQTSVLIELYENEYSENQVDLENGLLLVNGIIEGITPNLPKNSPLQVVFTLDKNGILQVLAKEISSGKELRLEYKSDAVLSEEEVQQQAEVMAGITVS